MPEPAIPLDRRAWLRAVLATAASGVTCAAPAQQGEAAPPLTLRTSTGEPVLPDASASQPASPPWRVLYLDFWASWCGPCRLSFPWMNELQQRHQAAGLRIVAVNLDARPQDAQDFLARVPAHFALAFDPAGESAKAFGLKAMPSSFLIAPDRRVLLAHRGFRADDRAGLERRIAAALG